MVVLFKSLEICNFKSFKGKVTLGPFNDFTAVIGPNGSGKSNVIDAICFVMGDTGKNLRIRKISELIYGASVQKPVTDSAYVTAFFELQDGTSKTFTRVIRLPASEFRVNEQVITLQLYMKELQKIGINMKAKNFVIYQGTIDRLALLSPKERTQFFEEISGSGELEREYNRLKTEKENNDMEMFNMMQIKKDFTLEKKCLFAEIDQANNYKKLQKHSMLKQQELQLFKLYHIQKDVEYLLDKKENLKSRTEVLQVEKNRTERVLDDDISSSNKLFKEFVEKEQQLHLLEVQRSKKELRFVEKKETIAQLKSKIHSTKRNLASAISAMEIRDQSIKNLQEALEVVARQKEQFKSDLEKQLESQKSNVELSTSQVRGYRKLKEEAVQRTAEYARMLESINTAQNSDKYSLENKNLQKMGLLDQLKGKTYKREMALNRICKLEELITSTRIDLERKTNAKNDLQTEVDASKAKVQQLQEELERVLEERRGAKDDNNLLTEMNNKAETVRILKERFTGVYGRLFELCQPINSTYNAAVAKVFGKNMDGIVIATEKEAIECVKYLKEQKLSRETFLPLDSVKAPMIKSRLRAVEELRERNVKLLYDVVKLDPNISRAVIFAANDSLVSETAKDARYVAYELDDNQRHNCVALDGTFYHKSGIISGGQLDLQRKAKKWEINYLVELKEKQEKLRAELRKSLDCSRRDYEVNTMCTQISGLQSRLKFSENDLQQARKEVLNLDEEIKGTEEMIKTLNDSIECVENAIKERKQRIEEIKEIITKIEDEVFGNFCKAVGIKNIREYEQTELLAYQEHERKLMEFDEQYNRIFHQVEFEKDSYAIREIKGNIERWECALNDLTTSLEKAKKNERQEAFDVAVHRTKIDELKEEFNNVSLRLDATKKKADNTRHQLAKISKELTGLERDLSGEVMKIKKAKALWDAIIRNAKAKDIPIPIISRDSTEGTQTMDTSSSSAINSQNLTSELLKIDFSNLSNNYKNRTPAVIDDNETHLTEEVNQILRKLNPIEKPNLKASGKIEALNEQISAVDREINERRKIASELTNDFNKIKQERLQRFTNCFEITAAEIDSIYKILMGSETAQALLAPENPEEPYLEGIRFDCIAPGKRLQSMNQHSGGEKTLAVLALLFAQCCYKPPPFLLFDEIDASLDNRNVRRLVNYVCSKKRNLQIIAISLQVRFFAHADQVIGVTSEPGELMESKAYDFPINLYPKKVKK